MCRICICAAKGYASIYGWGQKVLSDSMLTYSEQDAMPADATLVESQINECGGNADVSPAFWKLRSSQVF
jgi:hypothetical protein